MRNRAEAPLTLCRMRSRFSDSSLVFSSMKTDCLMLGEISAFAGASSTTAAASREPVRPILAREGTTGIRGIVCELLEDATFLLDEELVVEVRVTRMEAQRAPRAPTRRPCSIGRIFLKRKLSTRYHAAMREPRN